MFTCLNAGMLGINCRAGEAIDLAVRHGFGGVDLNVADIDDDLAIRRRLDDAGLRRGSAGGLLPGKTDVDDDAWNAAAAQLPALADRAAALGFTRTTAVVLPFHATLAAQQNLATHVRRLRQVGPVLAERGIRLGLEYVSQETRRAGQPNHFANNLRQLLPIIEEADQPNVGILLDSFHWHCAGETPDDIRRLGNGRLVVVHVNDAPHRPMCEQIAFERALPGATGQIDLAGFMAALREAAYDGPVTAEPFDPRLAGLPADEAAAETAHSLARLAG